MILSSLKNVFLCCNQTKVLEVYIVFLQGSCSSSVFRSFVHLEFPGFYLRGSLLLSKFFVPENYLEIKWDEKTKNLNRQMFDRTQWFCHTSTCLHRTPYLRLLGWPFTLLYVKKPVERLSSRLIKCCFSVFVLHKKLCLKN